METGNICVLDFFGIFTSQRGPQGGWLEAAVGNHCFQLTSRVFAYLRSSKLAIH